MRSRSQLRPDNPVRGIEDPISQKSIQRDRKLADRELVLVWRAAEALGYPFGPAVQLLVLTGQRRAEVLEATWDEFDLKARTWTIPRERAKNDREHVVPLSGAALAILEEPAARRRLAVPVHAPRARRRSRASAKLRRASTP